MEEPIKQPSCRTEKERGRGRGKGSRHKWWSLAHKSVSVQSERKG